MSPPEVEIYFREAGGLTSKHDIEIFRAWKRTFPGYDWNRASVDQHDGLTLYQDRSGTCSVLHFSNAICGYGLEGLNATVTILQEAGFGSRKVLEAKIWGRMHVDFTR